jgi:hypothetical protein
MFLALNMNLPHGSDLVIILGAAACIAGLVILINAFVTGRKRVTAPARSPSPQKGAPSTSSEKYDYSHSFPPIHQAYFSGLVAGGAHVQCVDLAVAPKPLLRLDVDYRHADPASFNFTGFSVADIRALGNFPDYAKLSGVPLPAPLPDFDVDKAVPRPYRPFRWSYHQTMCMSPFSVC